MPYSYLDLLCLTVVPSRYRLIVDDCLEFAKRFAKEIAVRENDVRERNIQMLFRTFSVSEHYASIMGDQAPPNGPKGGLSTGIPYFTISREEILLSFVIILLYRIILFCVLNVTTFSK